MFAFHDDDIEHIAESIALGEELSRETVATYKDSLREIQVDYVRYRTLFQRIGLVDGEFQGCLEFLFKCSGEVYTRRLPHFYSVDDFISLFLFGEHISYPKAYKSFLNPYTDGFFLINDEKILYCSAHHSDTIPLLWKENDIYKINHELFDHIKHREL